MNADFMAVPPKNQNSNGSLMVRLFEQKLLAPERTYQKIKPMFDWAVSPGGVWRAKLDVKRAVEEAPTARRWLAEMPSDEAILAAREQFRECVTVAATALEIDLIVAVLIDGFPNARLKNLDTYIEVMRMVLLDDNAALAVSAPVTASSVKRILSASRFLPTISEFVEVVIATRAKFAAGFDFADHCRELRWSAEDVLLEIGELKLDGGPDAIPF